MIYSYQITIDNNINKVFLDVPTANDKGLLEYEGKSIAKLRTWLESQTGAFGHIIGITTTPMDLDYVLANYCSWDYKVLSGEVFNYSTGLAPNQLS